VDRTFVNIACGSTYIQGWYNFDYAPVSSVVSKVNLLGRLPLNDASVDVLYSSHFLEHIPRKRVSQFLSECFRVLKPDGQIRLVLPDLEEICREYLRLRESGEHLKADFVVLELIDQCVRSESGGELGRYYNRLSLADKKSELADFIAIRTGEKEISTPIVIPKLSWGRMKDAFCQPRKVLGVLERFYCRLVTRLLPSAFREQNVSFAHVGERHAWIYDFYELSKLLEQAGFVSIQKLSCDKSNISGFPVNELDVSVEGRPRKGVQSMYVEALKL